MKTVFSIPLNLPVIVPQIPVFAAISFFRLIKSTDCDRCKYNVNAELWTVTVAD